MLENKNKREINWQLLIRTRKYLFYTIGLALVSAGIVALAIVPQTKLIWDNYQQHQAELPKLSRLEQKLTSLETIRFSPEFAQVDLVNQVLPSRKPLQELMVSLSSISSSTGVTIKHFEISPGIVASDAAAVAAQVRGPSQSGIDTLDVSLTVEGSDLEVQNFIQSVENMAPFTMITQLALTTKLGESEQSRREAEMSTSTYFFTQSIRATVEAPLPQIATAEQQLLASLNDLVPITVPEQHLIVGGGLEDLFGVDPLLFEE